jgi:hypothetical protein
MVRPARFGVVDSLFCLFSVSCLLFGLSRVFCLFLSLSFFVSTYSFISVSPSPSLSLPLQKETDVLSKLSSDILNRERDRHRHRHRYRDLVNENVNQSISTSTRGNCSIVYIRLLGRGRSSSLPVSYSLPHSISFTCPAFLHFTD